MIATYSEIRHSPERNRTTSTYTIEKVEDIRSELVLENGDQRIGRHCAVEGVCRVVGIGLVRAVVDWMRAILKQTTIPTVRVQRALTSLPFARCAMMSSAVGSRISARIFGTSLKESTSLYEGIRYDWNGSE